MEFKGYFQNAELSEASYSDFEGLTKTEEIKAALILEGFSDAQAADFVTHWKVVNHQPDTLSGFSATLFESLDNPGHYTLGIRGTLGLLDVAEDIFGVALQGVAARQAVDLYRYYKRLTTPKGQAVAYSQPELLLLAGLTSGNFSPLTTTVSYPVIVAATHGDEGLLDALSAPACFGDRSQSDPRAARSW